MTFNGQTTTHNSKNEANQIEISLDLSEVLSAEWDVFTLSTRVENELGNSTEVESTLVVISESLPVHASVPVSVHLHMTYVHAYMIPVHLYT